MNKTYIMLPCYNEAKSLTPLNKKFVALKDTFDFELFYVNDGSTDETLEMIEGFAEEFEFIHTIDHGVNKGLAGAMRTILSYADANFDKNDILITLDSDDTHNPKIIPNMVEKLQQDALDIVIASRFTDGGQELGLSLIRKLYSRGAKLFCKLMFRIKQVNDYSCGYRAYRVGLIQNMMQYYKNKVVTVDGFECMVEILVKSKALNVKAGEYPLVLEYNLKQSPSKMRAMKTILGYFKLGWQLRGI